MNPARRLRRDANAIVRLMQMSAAEVFVFVEGRRDRFFYGGLCEAAFGVTKTPYVIVQTAEIDGPLGKPGLLVLFDKLKAQNRLCHVFQGKKSSVAICVDKDIDDLLALTRSSIHLIYTIYYSIENHLVEHGKLTHALAATCSCDPQQMHNHISNAQKWLNECAHTWQSWIVLIVLARRLKIRCDSNYGSTSRINCGVKGVVIQSEFESRLHFFETASGLLKAEFDTEVENITRQIAALYNEGQYHQVFKGQWYGVFALEEARGLIVDGLDETSFETRVFDVLQSTLDFEAEWAKYYVERLRAVAECVPVS